MKRIGTITVLLAAALALAAVALADPGHGHGKGEKTKGANGKLGPYQMTRTDGSSCGVDQPWANDTFVRTYKIKKQKNGTYRIERRDRGTFVTLGTLSPGKCETTSKHGSTVPAGVKGKFQGFLVGTVTGGTFNPAATCTGTSCGFTDVFITTFFGPAAQFSCFANSADCKFNYEYSAPGQHLRLHHWQDKGTGAGTMLKERFKGDISDNRVQ
jgi:hypothetical protein